MPTTGFFGLLWRFNAIAIALAASGAIAVLILIFGMFTRDFFQARNAPQQTTLVEVGEAPQPNVTYSLGQATGVEGTQIVLHNLERIYVGAQALPIKSRYAFDSDAVNVLLVDGQTASGRWLFDGVGQAVYGRTHIFDPATLDDFSKRVVVALLFSVFTADTNKDGTIDSRDDWALTAFTLKDGKRHVLHSGSGSLVSVRQTDDGNILTMYEEGQKTILASFAWDDFRLLGKSELPRLSTGAAPRPTQ